MAASFHTNWTNLNMVYHDPYDILGLRKGSTLQEVKDAYRRLCLQHHPDLCPPHLKTAAEKQFKEITSAYTLISRQASEQSFYQHNPPKYSYTAAHAATRSAPRYSNGVVGAVIAAPLVLLGIWLQHKLSQTHSEDPVVHPRPHGLFHPPVNPYLRDDLRPRTYSRFNNRVWSKREAAKQSHVSSEESGTSRHNDQYSNEKG